MRTATLALVLVLAGCADAPSSSLPATSGPASRAPARPPDAADGEWFWWLVDLDVEHTAYGSWIVYVYYGEARDGSGRTRTLRTLIELR